MQDLAFSFADELGPEKIIHIYDADVGLKAIVVVDNVAAGPAIGGVRIAPDADLTECARLARAMTLKNAMAGLAHGGGKAVIIADPTQPEAQKSVLVRAFARAIRQIEDYIPGPDMGTNETYMAHLKAAIGRAVGQPREIGGIPLDEIGATGFGLAIALEVGQKYTDFNLQGARIVVQGFGSVGQHAARFASERGARLVGVSDSRGRSKPSSQTRPPRLLEFKRSGASVTDFDEGEAADEEALIAMESDVWIPAARPDVITEDNAGRLNTKILAQGANIPATEAAEAILAEREILVIPDFVANAGGVICAAVEYHQGSEATAMQTIEDRIRANVNAVLARSRSEGELPRQAALAIATERVKKAMSWR